MSANLNTNYFDAHWLQADGSTAKRLFFLASEHEVRKAIVRMGGVPQKIVPHRRSIFNREFYSRDYKITFLKALQFHVDVGSSAGHGLLKVIEAEPNNAKRAEMQPTLDMLSAGGRFADAVALLPFVDHGVISLLQAGEAMGSVNDAIEDSVALLENRKAAWKTAMAAFSWIIIDIFSSVSTVFGMQYGAIPWLRDHPPEVTDKTKVVEYMDRIQQATVINGAVMWVTILASLVVVAIMLLAAMGPKQMKLKIFNFVSRLPMVRKVLVDGTLADTFMLCGRMIKNGVPLMRSLSVLESFSRVFVIGEFWRRVRTAVSGGNDLREAFRLGGLMTNQEVTVLAAHQDKHHLAKVMAALAKERKASAEMGMKQFVMFSIVLAIVYMLITVALSIWLLSAQNMGLDAGFGEIMKG